MTQASSMKGNSSFRSMPFPGARQTPCEIRQNEGKKGSEPRCILGFWGLLYNMPRIKGEGAMQFLCTPYSPDVSIYKPCLFSTPTIPRTSEALCKLLLLRSSHPYSLPKWVLNFSIKGLVTRVGFFFLLLCILVRHSVVILIGSASWLSDETALSVYVQLTIC